MGFFYVGNKTNRVLESSISDICAWAVANNLMSKELSASCRTVNCERSVGIVSGMTDIISVFQSTRVVDFLPDVTEHYTFGAEIALRYLGDHDYIKHSRSEKWGYDMVLCVLHNNVWSEEQKTIMHEALWNWHKASGNSVSVTGDSRVFEELFEATL